jgi:hypothetical protein
MHLHPPGNIPRAVLAIVILLVWLAFRRRPSKSSTKPRSRRFRFFGAAGNALQNLSVFVDPGVRYRVVQKLDEQDENDGDEDPADPAQHLERQLRRIRRGEQIDRLTILTKDKRW